MKRFEIREIVYFGGVDDFGWDLQIPPRFLEIGRVSVNPGGPRYWYVEWRFPFGEWHGWDQGR